MQPIALQGSRRGGSTQASCVVENHYSCGNKTGAICMQEEDDAELEECEGDMDLEDYTRMGGNRSAAYLTISRNMCARVPGSTSVAPGAPAAHGARMACLTEGVGRAIMCKA